MEEKEGLELIISRNRVPLALFLSLSFISSQQIFFFKMPRAIPTDVAMHLTRTKR